MSGERRARRCLVAAGLVLADVSDTGQAGVGHKAHHDGASWHLTAP
jgi:hypothetical protein